MLDQYWTTVNQLAPMILDKNHVCTDDCAHLGPSVYITNKEFNTVTHADRVSAAYAIANGLSRQATDAEVKKYLAAEEKSRIEQEAQRDREIAMYVRRPMIVDTPMEPATTKKSK